MLAHHVHAVPAGDAVTVDVGRKGNIPGGPTVPAVHGVAANDVGSYGARPAYLRIGKLQLGFGRAGGSPPGLASVSGHENSPIAKSHHSMILVGEEYGICRLDVRGGENHFPRRAPI